MLNDALASLLIAERTPESYLRQMPGVISLRPAQGPDPMQWDKLPGGVSASQAYENELFSC